MERYNSWSNAVTAYKINVHEDIMGSGIYYTRQNNGYTLNKHEYNVWGYNSKAPTYNYDPEYRATEPYFTGHPYDGALNLYYAHNRFYDAQTGQWLSEDPIQDGLNWYSYCENNPTTYVDLLGLRPVNLAIDKPDSFPQLDDLYESEDLSSGRLQLTSCGYQARKNRQTQIACVRITDYLWNTKDGNAYLSALEDYYLGIVDKQYCVYYLVACELMEFNEGWNKEYEDYEKAARKIQAEKDAQIYVNSFQQSGAEALSGLYDITYITLAGSGEERAFLQATMEKVIPQMMAEECREEVAETILLYVVLPKVAVATAFVMDKAIDAIQVAKKMDQVSDSIEVLTDTGRLVSGIGDVAEADRTIDKIQTVEHAQEAVENAKLAERMGNVQDGLRAADEVFEGGSGALSTPSSKVLRQNMIAAGVEVPDYPNAAHHIVAGNSPKAAEARAILQKYGIDINDPANGVFLPTAKDVAEGVYHPSLHTNAYYDEINNLLSGVTSKQETLDVLNYISESLQNGTFMK